MIIKEIITYKGKSYEVEFASVRTLEFLADLPLEKLEQMEAEAWKDLSLWLRLGKPRKHTIKQHLANYAYLKKAHSELLEELTSRQEI